MSEDENTQNEPCVVYDLIEYRLKKYVDSFYQGSEEWDVAMQLMLLYLDDDVTVKWSNDGILVSPTDSAKAGFSEILIPMSSSQQPS